MFRGLFALIAFLAAGLCAFADDGEMADSTYGGYGYRYSVKFFTTDKFLSVLSEESSGMIVLGAVGRFGDRYGAGFSARPGKGHDFMEGR